MLNFISGVKRPEAKPQAKPKGRPPKASAPRPFDLPQPLRRSTASEQIALLTQKLQELQESLSPSPQKSPPQPSEESEKVVQLTKLLQIKEDQIEQMRSGAASGSGGLSEAARLQDLLDAPSFGASETQGGRLVTELG